MIVPMWQDESKCGIRYAMWRPKASSEWLVIAQERVDEDPVVSVQFNPQKPKRSVPRAAPSPTISRELEYA
jgi:hypothetical protein